MEESKGKSTEKTSHASNEKSINAGDVLSNRAKRTYRRRGFSNLLKMGHCAPSVMQTLQDLENTKDIGLVRMTAGLPGGIGNTGLECGGITSPLINLGLKHGLSANDDGLPTVITAGHDYCARFVKCNNSLLCREILGDRRIPLPCIKVARHAPELYIQTSCNDNAEVISGECREALHLIYSHLSSNGFHCAHSVLNHLNNTVPLTQKFLDATSGFIGGTAFKGLTCSAFTAGLMAVGLKLGEIEDSIPRVARMLATMIAGGNAMADNMNKFNRILNLGYRMSEWFKNEFGSTLCSDLTKCDFSSSESVHKYIDNGTINTCKIVAEKVALRTEMIIKQKGAGF